MSITCSMGIMAYNEEANIGRMLEALVSQRTAKVTLTRDRGRRQRLYGPHRIHRARVGATGSSEFA